MSKIESGKRRRTWVWRLVAIVALVALFVGTAAFGGYYYKKYQDLNKLTAEQFSQRENSAIIKDVGGLYSLPKNEQPSIATIKDKEAVKKQYPFLNQAENGDVLLLYKGAQLAILYRPASKQLIKVGALNVQSNATIRVIGKQVDREAVIKSLATANVTATDGGDAKGAYTGVTVVDLSGQSASQAAQLASTLKGQVGELPPGEEKPADTDILIIAGPSQ